MYQGVCVRMAFWLMGQVVMGHALRGKNVHVPIMESPIHLEIEFNRTVTPGEPIILSLHR